MSIFTFTKIRSLPFYILLALVLVFIGTVIYGSLSLKSVQISHLGKKPDGWKSYNSLEKLGYHHEPYVQRTGGEEALEQLDHVHLVISLLKRWLEGTHHGAVKPQHLQAYLDEFSFRFNRRLSNHRGMLFYRLVQQSMLARPLGIKDFYKSQPQDVGGLESIS